MALIAGAAISAAVAAFVPLREVVERDSFEVFGGGIAINVGDDVVLVTPPGGWVISGWGTNDDGSASVVFGRADPSAGSVTLLIAGDGSMQWHGSPEDVRELQAGVRLTSPRSGLPPQPSIAPAPLP